MMHVKLVEFVDACIYGAQILQENLDKSMPGGKVIYDLYTRIVKLRDDLIELGNHPDVRFEAFPCMDWWGVRV